MADETTTATSSGFPTLLLLLFITLKLTGVIDWSWWWVLSPAWITAGIALIVVMIVGIVVLVRHRS